MSKRRGARSVRTWIDAPLRPRLTTAIGASSSSRSSYLLPISALASSRLANSRSGARVADQRDPVPATEGEQRRGGREVDGDERTGRAAQPDRLHAGPPERLVEERVGREVDGLGAGEPVGLEVLGAQPERGATVLDERALAVGLDEHADPPGPRARHAHGPHGHAVVGCRRDQCPARPRRDRSHTRASSAPRAARAIAPPWPPSRRRARGRCRGRRCRARCRLPARGSRPPRCRRRRRPAIAGSRAGAGGGCARGGSRAGLACPRG